MIKNFCNGVRCALTGIRLFFREKRLWKYVGLPLSILFLIYSLILWGALRLGSALSDRLQQWTASLPAWIGSLLGGSALLLCLLAAGFLLVSGFCILYGAFAGLFFDAMAESFEKYHYGFERNRLGLKNEALYVKDSVLYGLGTLLLLLLLSLSCLFLPVVGEILLTVVMAYRFGIVCLMSTGFNHGMRLRQLRALASKNILLCFGFGLTAYALILLLPLASLFALPGLVAGGALLFHEMTDPPPRLPEKREHSASAAVR